MSDLNQGARRFKCLRDTDDENMQGPCAAGRCEWPNCSERTARRTPAATTGELPISDAEIAGFMGWRGPGAYTAASLRKIRRIVEHAIAADRAQQAGAAAPHVLSLHKWGGKGKTHQYKMSDGTIQTLSEKDALLSAANHANSLKAKDAEIAELRAQLAAKGQGEPVGYLSHAALDRLKAGRTAALLPKALDGKDRIALYAAPASAQPADPEAELLNMLGRIHPLAMSERCNKEQRDERVRRAFTRQQPWPVPDQACIVWRWDVMTMACDLTELRAYRRLTEEREASAQPDQRESAVEIINQCDGCRTGAAINAYGNHVNSSGVPFMACQARKYAAAPSLATD